MTNRFDTGLINVVKGLTSVEGVGTQWVPAHSGSLMKIGFEGSMYIFTYTSATSGTLSIPAENNLTKARYALWGDF